MFQGMDKRIAWMAWGASIGLHVVLLAAWGVIRLEVLPSTAAASDGAVVCLTAPQHPAQPLVTKKPAVRTEPALQKQAAQDIVPMVSSQSAAVQSSSEHQFYPDAPQYLSPLANTSQGQASPANVEFFGQRAYTRSVCFVVDASASMYGRFNTVRRQLKETIASLQSDQQFYLIFFRADQLLENGDGKLIVVNGTSKAAAFDLIDKTHLRGGTNALAAIERAMQIRDGSGRPPALIFFLTDGFDLTDDGSSDSFISRIDSLRQKLAPTAVINTLGFWATPADQAILNAVAQKTGGQFLHLE